MPSYLPDDNAFGHGGHEISTWMHQSMMIVMFGKAAVGGAGLTLAVLGAVNAVAAALSHTWVAGGSYVPYVVAVGAVISGIYQVISNRAA